MICYELILDETAEGQRIDACLRRFLPQVPPSVWQSSLRRRDVKVNGVRVRQDARVHAGDRVQAYCVEQAADPLDVVWEDADVLVVNKRAGVSVEADLKGGVSLTELAARHVRQADMDAWAPRPCHRLDNQTCGLVLFAKHPRAEEILTRAFRERTLDKRYICLVRGRMKPPAATCRAYLIKDAAAARVRVVDHPASGAKPIVTAYETLEAGPVSRLEVHLITGRTHQIRAHLAALGHPLLGDDVYGDRAFNRAHKARRLMLCACRLTLDTAGELPQLDGRTFAIDCPF